MVVYNFHGKPQSDCSVKKMLNSLAALVASHFVFNVLSLEVGYKHVLKKNLKIEIAVILTIFLFDVLSAFQVSSRS